MNNHKRNCEMSALGWCATVPLECTCNKEEKSKEELRKKLEAGATDFAERFTGVMKELAEEEELREEFVKWTKESKLLKLEKGEYYIRKGYEPEEIADWWLSKFASHQLEMEKKIDELMVGGTDEFERGYKQAKLDTLSILRGEK